MSYDPNVGAYAPSRHRTRDELFVERRGTISALAQLFLVAAALTPILFARPARAADLLVLGDAKLDRPTVVSLGVQLLISGDDNFNATVAVRYRKQGMTIWSTGPSLTRVHPEVVKGRTIVPQFAGSIIDLAPDTTYDIELHAVDPDGLPETVRPVTGKTRAVPRKDPATPNVKMVANATEFADALRVAKAGDVITLARGTYVGPFSIPASASGTAENPIVIRGEDRDGVILDGGGCNSCNVIEVLGSFVYVERLTIQNAERALRWQTDGAEGNVLRRVHVKDVTMGTGGRDNQKDFYISDNVFEGRLTWPFIDSDDNNMHGDNDGIVVSGSGHVVCHNTVSGFADALQNHQDGARSIDFYGNEILWTYDDGIELDGIEGNGRAWRNRFSNTYDTISFQPIFGGPVYVTRNVVVNVANEPLKLHAEAATPRNPLEEPSGVLVFHNTFVKAGAAIQVATEDVVHFYRVQNNLWIAHPADDGKVVKWETPIDSATGVIDSNGYSPDGKFEFGDRPTDPTYPNFAAVVAGGLYEKNGTLLENATFASGLTAPSDYKPKLEPQDVRLAAGSQAIDKAVAIVGINDVFNGAAPDLGAIEFGDPMPAYGPRPEGVDESNAPAHRARR